MIKKLIEKNNAKKQEKYNNRPRFAIKNLYLAEICLLQNQKHEGGLFGTTTSYGSIRKKYAICYANSEYDSEFLHIKSNQIIKSTLYADIGDYAIFNSCTFRSAFPLGMRKLNLTENDRLSIKEIIDLEDELNKRYAPNIEVDDLIK